MDSSIRVYNPIQSTKTMQYLIKEDEDSNNRGFVKVGGETSSNNCSFKCRWGGRWIKCIIYWCTSCCGWAQYVC